MASVNYTNGSGSKSKRSTGRIEIGGSVPNSLSPDTSDREESPALPEDASSATLEDERGPSLKSELHEQKPSTAPPLRRPTLYEPPVTTQVTPPPVTPDPTPTPSPRSTARERSEASSASSQARSPRRPAEQRENAFQAMAWLLEGVTGMVEELRHSDLGLSEEFWVHAYAARREALLAARTVVDQLLEKADAADRQEEERRLRRDRRGGINISDS